MLKEVLGVERVSANHRLESLVAVNQIVVRSHASQIMIQAVLDESYLDFASCARLLKSQQIGKVVLNEVLRRGEALQMARQEVAARPAELVLHVRIGT